MLSLPRGRNLALSLAGLFLCGYVAVLLWVYYQSQMELRQGALGRFTREAEKAAATLSYFFSECKDDVVELGRRRVLAAYFENRALKMTMEYGLGASLVEMGAEFQRFLDEKKVGGVAVYRRVLLLDKEGKVLVKRGAGGAGEVLSETYGRALGFSGLPSTEAVVRVEPGSKGPEVRVTVPYFFKGRMEGRIIAWIDLRGAYACLARRDHEFSGEYQVLVTEGAPGTAMELLGKGRFLLEEDLGALDAKRPVWRKMERPDGTAPGVLAVKVPVEGTPFSLFICVPAREVSGGLHPGVLLSALAALGTLALGGSAVLVRAIVRNLVLAARLEESVAREREIHRTNERLREEIASRKEVQQALKSARDELEQRVAERTRELEAAHQVLVQKALEAGRAQMSAIVLHNIGNAITPVPVHLGELKSPVLLDLCRNMERCHADLADHLHELGRYVREDPRGREVFAYLGELARETGKVERRKALCVERIQSSVEFVSEILSLQHSYAAAGADLRERVDLDALVADALRMQHASLQSRSIAVETSLRGPEAGVVINRSQLMQVVVNCIKNAYESIEETRNGGGRIRVDTSVEDERAVLRIEDTGVGFDPGGGEDFFQFGRSTKGSTGMGLYYCRKFMEANRGRLTLHSEGKGKGAAVFMTFPLVNPR